MIALIARITTGALGWVMPGFGPGLAYVLAGLIGFGSIVGFAFLRGAEGKSAAVATERAACTTSKAEDAAASARALNDILAMIQRPEDDDGDKTAAQLCASSPFCRDGGKKK